MKARVRQLRVELESMKKGNKSVTEYVLALKSITNSLLAVGDSITEQDQIDLILDDLPEGYNSFVMQMYGRHKLSHSLMLRHFFMCKKLNLISSGSILNVSVNLVHANSQTGGVRETLANNRSQGSVNRVRGHGQGCSSSSSRLTSQLCGKYGHVVADC